ncbi:nitrate reductase molybdenum cofactor assembly chaperone [Spirillospora sp. NPDC047279]|uniref:nitrate reductase molybdenum cofactor assembly chaperone n=1 Tax=Spirillospora sp. NPDC047279 TaxID=3155478 RepID=UPI0033CA6238
MDIVVWRAAALLLTYPDQRFYNRRPMLRAVVEELSPSPAARPLAGFLDHAEGTTPVRLGVQYMEMRRCTSLHLTYHSGLDAEHRLAARTRLADLYRAAEWGQGEGEEPDFLPVVLEFAAHCADEWLLLEHRAALERVRSGLVAQCTPYAALVEAVCATLPEPRGNAEKGHDHTPPAGGDLAMTLETWGSSA